ncbi:MAG: hypothetical protein GX072_00125, partial [Lysinibacillus sp.]|nr:hypothetical protein [Lysinibacillus sp.]
LKEIVHKYPLEEKIVVVDSHRIGLQISEAFIKKVYSAINLKFQTVEDLATEFVTIYGQAVKRLKPAVGEQFIYSILSNLKNEQKLTYFHEMEVTPSFSRSVYQAIQLIRLAGFTKDDFPYDAFITKEKAEDFYLILKSYEEILTSQGLLDKGAIFQKAREVATKKDAIFILQSNLHLSFLEEEFLQAILPENVDKLPLTPVYGIIPPKRSPLQSIVFGEDKALSYLYELEKLRERPNIQCFIGKTEEVEIKHVLEKIKRSNDSFDEHVIFYTSTEPYVTTIYHLSEKLNIPITFSEGLSIAQSKPGRFVAHICNWIRSNYSASAFIHLLQEGLMELGEGAPSNNKITNLVRELKIGWDKDRYIHLLKQRADELLEKMKRAENESKKQYYEEKQIECQWLLRWFKKAFSQLPDFASSMNVGEVLRGIRFLVENYSKTTGAMDIIAKNALLEEIQTILPYANEKLSLYDVFEKVSHLLSLRIMQSPPKPGHLHVASYKSGVYNNRPNVFIVGLDH